MSLIGPYVATFGPHVAPIRTLLGLTSLLSGGDPTNTGSHPLGMSTSLILTTARPTAELRIFRSAASSPLVLRGERWVRQLSPPKKFAPGTQNLRRSTSTPTHRMPKVAHASAHFQLLRLICVLPHAYVNACR